MAFSIRIAGASFTKFFDRQVPYLDQATGLWLFGGSEAESAQNLIEGGGLGTKVGPGTITYADATMTIPTLTNSAAIDTGITLDFAANNAFTFISVSTIPLPAAAPTSNQYKVCGTRTATLNGSSMYRAQLGVGAQWNNTAQLAITGAAVAVDAMVMAAQTNGPTGRGTYMHDGTTLLSSTLAGQGAAPVAGPYRIGPYDAALGNYAVSLPQTHAANMLFPVALTSAQLIELHDYFKFRLATRGVSVV